MTLAKYKGFSLVEMALVTFVVGLLFVGFSSNIGSFLHSSNSMESKSNLEKVRKALYQYAVIQKHLPCPDSSVSSNGQENRTGLICDADYGFVPYLDLGLNADDVEDAWGNRFAYAVNQDTTNASLICDVNSSASYFCNQYSGRGANFDFANTPPIQGLASSGNYTLCNERVLSCSAATPAQGIETNEAIAILVAFNEDGANTLSSCASTTGATQENCDLDVFYHQLSRTNEEGRYFDDVVLPLSGYQLKSLVLGSVLSYNTYASTTGGEKHPTPTFSSFDLTGEGDSKYTPNSGVDEYGNPTDDDVVIVNRDLTADMDFGEGDDYIAVGNDVTSEVSTGIGDDTLYIINELTGEVDMGVGNDLFVLGTSLISTVLMGEGNDKVWVQKDIQSGSNLSLGEGEDVLYLGDPKDPSSGEIYAPIDGGNEGGVNDYDILVLENVSDWGDLSLEERGYIQNFELILFSADADGNRAFYEYK